MKYSILHCNAWFEIYIVGTNPYKQHLLQLNQHAKESINIVKEKYHLVDNFLKRQYRLHY